jgi:PAS domain S-box-containing protein
LTIDNFIEGKLDFKHLQAYALFLKNHRLEQLVKEQLEIARAIKVPMLKYFEGMQENELLQMSMVSTAALLDFLIQNKAEEQIAASTSQWVKNQLPNVRKEQIVAEDITLVSFMRREAMIKFLPEFSDDITEILEIIKEINRYIVKSETAATNTYINLLKDGLAEETHFNNSIADTAPGIIFIYDLEKRKHVYINDKVEQLYGYEPGELKALGYKIYDELIHPDDQHSFNNRYPNLLVLKDGEVRSLEYRLKLKDGHYRWLKNYESVFKRSEDGRPIQVIGFAINIDTEKQTAEQLEHNRAQLLEAQELTEMGSFVWDLVTNASESSPQVQKIFELPENSRLADFIEKVHPADRHRLQKCLEQAIGGGGNYDCEYRYVTGDKEKILWSRGVVTFEDGKAVKMKGTVMDVSERHHMIQRLQRSEELYKQAQALSHMGNWTWDIRTNQVTWTDELYRIFGMNPQSEQIDLEKFFSFIHSEDREKRMIELENALQSRKPHEYNFRIVLRDGKIKILHGQAEVLLDTNGKPFKMFGACQDVTQQKLVEKELLDNQNFIRKIADAAPSIISAYNIHTGKYLFINQAFEKLLGYKKEEVMEKGLPFLISLVHPDDLQMLTEKNTQAIAMANDPDYVPVHEVIMEFTYRLKHRNGNYRWLQTFATIFDRNADNEVEHLLNISADITEMVETERKVKEQEHFIQQVADASPTVLYLFDVKSASIIYINKEIEHVLGYQPADVISMGNNIIPEVFHPDDAAQMQVRLKDYNLAENPKFLFEFECRLKNVQGEWCWFLVREVVFRRNAKGKVSEVLGAALDISLRKEMEDKLHHQTIALQQSNTSLQEFAYVASHDLKEPLRKISTFSDRLLTSFDKSLPAEANTYLEKIIDSSRRMQQLIDDLLSISMISSEKNFVRYNLKTLAEDALQSLEHKIEEKKAVVHLQHLPDATVIPSQFRQLFQNLFSNSLKFSNKGVVPEISVTYTFLTYAEVSHMNLNKSSRYLQIKITDNGIGFEKVFADKIFTIFQRLHNRSQYEGTGIGLAICKRIVENHGGVIFASGQQHTGASFTIIIPHTA